MDDLLRAQIILKAVNTFPVRSVTKENFYKARSAYRLLKKNDWKRIYPGDLSIYFGDIVWNNEPANMFNTLEARFSQYKRIRVAGVNLKSSHMRDIIRKAIKCQMHIDREMWISRKHGSSLSGFVKLYEKDITTLKAVLVRYASKG